MRALVLLAAAALSAVPAAGASASAPAVSAKAFVDGIYRPWLAALARHAAYLPPNDRRLYTPDLAALLARDVAMTPAGEVGMIDYVILCGCQDDTGLRETTTMVSATPGDAAVRVDLRFAGTGRETLMLRLTRLAAGWRIADVVAHGSSLKQTLIAGLRARHRRPADSRPVVSHRRRP